MVGSGWTGSVAPGHQVIDRLLSFSTPPSSYFIALFLSFFLSLVQSYLNSCKIKPIRDRSGVPLFPFPLAHTTLVPFASINFDIHLLLLWERERRPSLVDFTTNNSRLIEGRRRRRRRRRRRKVLLSIIMWIRYWAKTTTTTFFLFSSSSPLDAAELTRIYLCDPHFLLLLYTLFPSVSYSAGGGGGGGYIDVSISLYPVRLMLSRLIHAFFFFSSLSLSTMCWNKIEEMLILPCPCQWLHLFIYWSAHSVGRTRPHPLLFFIRVKLITTWMKCGGVSLIWKRRV